MNWNNNFLDSVNLASFVLGLMNLQENLTQGDKQDLLEEFNNKTKVLMDSVNAHLQEQDEKIDKILEILESLKS